MPTNIIFFHAVSHSGLAGISKCRRGVHTCGLHLLYDIEKGQNYRSGIGMPLAHASLKAAGHIVRLPSAGSFYFDIRSCSILHSIVIISMIFLIAPQYVYVSYILSNIYYRSWELTC